MRPQIHWVEKWNTFAECPETLDWGCAIPLEKALSLWDGDSDIGGEHLMPHKDHHWTVDAFNKVKSIQEACDEREEENMQDHLSTLSDACNCCPHCWDVPCGGCQAGGMCESHCCCDEREGDGND